MGKVKRVLFVGLLLLTMSNSALCQGREEEVKVAIGAGTLKGTLCLPEIAVPCPVVLIISGSGPTDRNGNNPYGITANYLKMLADDLAQSGIASLRYDKRGIGKSCTLMLREEDLRFDDYVQDAIAWVSNLRQDKRFNAVFIAGHSEGALIGTIAARQQSVDGLALLAGAGYPLQTTLLRQIAERQPQLYSACAGIIAKLGQGELVKVDDPVLQPLFRPSVQPYLISQFRFDPREEIRKVNVPILLIQGTHDLQIRPADAQTLHCANPRSKLVLIEGMNHVLKSVPDDLQANLAAYTDPARPLAAQLVPALADFVLRTTCKAPPS